MWGSMRCLLHSRGPRDARLTLSRRHNTSPDGGRISRAKGSGREPKRPPACGGSRDQPRPPRSVAGGRDAARGTRGRCSPRTRGRRGLGDGDGRSRPIRRVMRGTPVAVIPYRSRRGALSTKWGWRWPSAGSLVRRSLAGGNAGARFSLSSITAGGTDMRHRSLCDGVTPLRSTLGWLVSSSRQAESRSR